VIVRGELEPIHILHLQNPLLTVEGIFDHILDLGSLGRLDYLILGGSNRRHHLEPDGRFESEDTTSLETLIREAPGSPPNGAYIHETEVQLMKIVKSILDRFAAHVKVNPFEDAQGSYFNSPPAES
jgi:hypothetical protein